MLVMPVTCAMLHAFPVKPLVSASNNLCYLLLIRCSILSRHSTFQSVADLFYSVVSVLFCNYSYCKLICSWKKSYYYCIVIID